MNNIIWLTKSVDEVEKALERSVEEGTYTNIEKQIIFTLYLTRNRSQQISYLYSHDILGIRRIFIEYVELKEYVGKTI